MSSGVADRDRVVSLRSLAHPVRLRMLSLLTGAPMSAAEVARELGLTHANASYHLRQLLAAGQLVEAGRSRSAAAVAKRYRYDVDAPGATSHDAGDRATFFRLLASELVRRSAAIEPTAKQTSTDAELWVDPDDWAAVLGSGQPGALGPPPAGSASAYRRNRARERDRVALRDVRPGRGSRRERARPAAPSVVRRAASGRRLDDRQRDGQHRGRLRGARPDRVGHRPRPRARGAQLPQVVFLLFGGVIADRLPRHLVLSSPTWSAA